MIKEHQDILHKKLMMPLQYQEVYNELYDHFQEAITASQQEGYSFQEALDLHYASFGGTVGLEKIEQDYRKLYRFRYLRLFLDQWKQIPLMHFLLIVLLLLVYSMLAPLWENSWYLSVSILGFAPALLSLWELVRQQNQFSSPFKSLRARGLWSASALNLFLIYGVLYGGNLQLIRNWYASAPNWFFYAILTLLALSLSAFIRLVQKTRTERIPLS